MGARAPVRVLVLLPDPEMFRSRAGALHRHRYGQDQQAHADAGYPRGHLV